MGRGLREGVRLPPPPLVILDSPVLRPRDFCAGYMSPQLMRYPDEGTHDTIAMVRKIKLGNACGSKRRG